MEASPNTNKILQILTQTYPELPIPLKHRNAFELLIAVILSAQCTDARVNTVTPKLFPNDRPCAAADILKLGEDQVRKIIYPCGYYNSKTKAIMGCAHALLNKEVSSNFQELTALPGVGAKTAQVVQAQAFGIDAFPVDTHVHRVCNRLGLADSGKNRDKTERQVKATISQKHWSRLHLELIYHGRALCTARKPKCSECPLNKLCPSSEA
ncbi:endonuclease III [Candidatus Peregrinibacteria bacterium]|jgi:endonuclease III|nr:endonuclease III [Candidatus Peregrinibacteria bacterium]MBT4632060.1 endonuclease III [Candidatus Peregrinibacteria bacterium]MBT5516293.1 endonuclease III [Candidatus Peregrinibacteria bacterium]MBT5823714.1 endonuclease III [Candidatus Peregrinibacteria bacterium]